MYMDAIAPLWVVGTERELHEAIVSRTLTANQSVEDEHFRSAYEWLADQLKRRLPGYTGKIPILAWYEKPKNLEFGYLPPGTRGVCIKCQIPVERVLSINSEGWLTVLNQWHLPLARDELLIFEGINVGIGSFDNLEPLQQQVVVDSWDRIFDVTAMKKAGYDPELCALVEKVEASEFCWNEFTSFTARPIEEARMELA